MIANFSDLKKAYRILHGTWLDISIKMENVESWKAPQYDSGVTKDIRRLVEDCNVLLMQRMDFVKSENECRLIQ
jgi:hypothetical protein